MNSKQQKLFLTGLVVFLVALFSMLFNSISRDLVDKIRASEYELYCIFEDGERRIEPELVVDFDDGVFLFINGEASNCRVVK